MKIEELSIGDWVRYRDREWIVCSLYQFTEEVGLWRKDSQFCEYVADIEPIPLTPEILEKNGFCPPPKHCGYHHLTAGNKEVFVRIDNGFSEFSHYSKGFVSDEECLNKLEISHSMSVHELQHALRLAGIEKEIELK